MSSKWQTGLMGEFKAMRFLKKQGMKILAFRYRTRHGEIDLIARDGNETVFIEVKSRPSGKMGEGIRAVNQEKRQHLRYAAKCYLSAHPASSFRFDVIEISAAGLRHFKQAF